MKSLRFFSTIILIVPIAALAGDKTGWPCFHGPKRNNLSAETGLLASWPDEGPKLLWTNSDIGHGYSTVAIVGDRIFTAGMINKQTYVAALDMDGKKLWQSLNGQSWEASARQSWAVPYAGSRGTPTVDGEVVYHLSELGRLAVFDIETGKERWHLELLKAFEAERPEYGYSESVLIHGDKLFCCPGGNKGYAAAFDKGTGRMLWANTEIKDPVGNCSAIIATINEVEQIITMSQKRVLSFEPDSGSLLWQFEFGNKRENSCTDVIVSDGLVFATTGYGGGCILLRPQRQADGKFSVEQVWRSELLDNHHGGVVLLDGHLYGAGHESRGWFCLDFMTGGKLWQSRGKGSLTYAEDRLYCLDEKGTMSLIGATNQKWDKVSSFRMPRGGRGLYWAHPVVYDGRLYVRHSEQLFAYDIRVD
jgi:outer membrane protein assembly factor BamB